LIQVGHSLQGRGRWFEFILKRWKLIPIADFRAKSGKLLPVNLKISFLAAKWVIIQLTLEKFSGEKGTCEMNNLQRTALYDQHVSLGAMMVAFAGLEMPIQYPTGIIDEHLATIQ